MRRSLPWKSSLLLSIATRVLPTIATTVPVVSCSVDQPQLFTNPSFEDGSFNGWTIVNEANAVVVEAGSSSSLFSTAADGQYLVQTHSSTPRGVDALFLHQTLTDLDTSMTYTITFSIAGASNGVTGTQYCYTYIFKDSQTNANLLKEYVTTMGSSGLDWTEYSFEFQPTASSHLILFLPECTLSNYYVAFDNFQFLQPATTSCSTSYSTVPTSSIATPSSVVSSPSATPTPSSHTVTTSASSTHSVMPSASPTSTRASVSVSISSTPAASTSSPVSHSSTYVSIPVSVPSSSRVRVSSSSSLPFASSSSVITRSRSLVISSPSRRPIVSSTRRPITVSHTATLSSTNVATASGSPLPVHSSTSELSPTPSIPSSTSGLSSTTSIPSVIPGLPQPGDCVGKNCGGNGSEPNGSNVPTVTSLTPPTSTTNGGGEVVTETLYTTSTATIYKCPTTVTNCPASEKTPYTTSNVLATATTVYTKTDTRTTSTLANPVVTETLYTTRVSTIYKCPPSVTNCPASEKTPYTTSDILPAGTIVYTKGNTQTASSIAMTVVTKTLYTTRVSTVYVTDCPESERTTYTTSEVVATGTTVYTEAGAPTTTTVANPVITETLYTTRFSTIYKCPASVTNCPASEKTAYTTSEVLATGTTVYTTSAATDVSAAATTVLVGLADHETTTVTLYASATGHPESAEAAPSVDESQAPGNDNSLPPEGSSLTSSNVNSSAPSTINKSNGSSLVNVNSSSDDNVIETPSTPQSVAAVSTNPESASDNHNSNQPSSPTDTSNSESGQTISSASFIPGGLPTTLKSSSTSHYATSLSSTILSSSKYPGSTTTDSNGAVYTGSGVSQISRVSASFALVCGLLAMVFVL